MKTVIISCMAAILLFLGCTEPSSEEPFVLSEAVEDPVTIILEKDGTGIISLSVDPALPQAEAGDAAIEAALGDSIELTVINEDTSVTAVLSEGTLVGEKPSGVGEYSVSLSADRMTLNVTFWNEFDGSSLYADGNYSAVVSVAANELNFAVEEFSREVQIQEE